LLISLGQQQFLLFSLATVRIPDTLQEIAWAMALEPGKVAVLIEHARLHVLCNDVATALIERYRDNGLY
jgi:hypothetical protein